MKKLCDYGCGREAKHYFPTVDKWCCSPSYNSCPISREKNKLALNQPEVKEKHSKVAKNIHNQLDIKVKHSKAAKKAWNDPKLRIKQSKSHQLTIEKIQEKYPTFSEEEEMRYNPNGEIQVHCKYSECKNSKENGGWFTPIYIQLYERIRQLEHKNGNDGSHLYCSEGCKQKCCLYRLISDPNTLKEFKKYSIKLWKETNKTLKKHSDKIKNIELRGYEHGYALDHKYSIYDGFINNINSKTIAHYKNLQIITIVENNKKNKKSSITLEELLVDIDQIEADEVLQLK